jgi:hypothetical protein
LNINICSASNAETETYVSRRSSVLKLLSFLMTAILVVVPSLAQQSRNTISGCLTGEPNNLILGAVPSGNTFRLQGKTEELVRHRNQLVRLIGSEVTPASEKHAGTFTVQQVEALADTCTAPLPPQRPEDIRGVTGKAGAHQSAVPLSDTRSAGKVTPGYQTEAGGAQQPGGSAQAPANERNKTPARGRLAPPEWGQVGQSQTSADRSAAAAERAEEEPGETLGVDNEGSKAPPAWDGEPEALPVSNGKKSTRSDKAKP